METKRKRQKIRSIFGEQLEQIVRERNLSHRVLAQMAGVSTSVIGSWIGAGGAIPSDLSKVSDLCNALGVSFHWMLLGEHPKSKQPTAIEMFEEIIDPNISGYWKIEAKKLVPRKQ